MRGTVQGTVKKGDAVYVCNPGEDEGAIFLTTVTGIETAAGGTVERASGVKAALRLERGKKYLIKKGTVVFHRNASTAAVHQAYVSALGGRVCGLAEAGAERAGPGEHEPHRLRRGMASLFVVPLHNFRDGKPEAKKRGKPRQAGGADVQKALGRKRDLLRRQQKDGASPISFLTPFHSRGAMSAPRRTSAS